jgi:Transposase
VVCNPRQNALLKAGNKSDQIDARKLAELLRADLLSPVYHGENRCRILKEFVRSYTTLTEDTTRIMARLKALYRSHALACAGKKPYGKRHRQEWLQPVRQPGLASRAQRLYDQLDAVPTLRRAAKREMLAQSHKDGGYRLLCSIPYLGPVRASIPMARAQGAQSLSHPASVLGLLRAGAGDPHQRGVSRGARAGAALAEASVHSRAQSPSQSRSEKCFQGGGHRGQPPRRTAA